MVMQIFNYHTHTFRCGHANGTDEDYVAAAIEAGYKVLGFSDHTPYKNYPLKGIRMNWEDLDNYISSINSLKEKYKNQIQILLGLESEYYPEFIDEKKELLSKLDYLILGQHFTHPDAKINYFNHNSDEQILEYGKTVCEAMESGLFKYVCHPDVFMNNQTEFNDTCIKTSHMICKKAAELDMPLEININGVRKGKTTFPQGERYYYPFKEFWEIAASYNNKCLYGVDAHDPSLILDKQKIIDAQNELKDLNLNMIEKPFI